MANEHSKIPIATTKTVDSNETKQMIDVTAKSKWSNSLEAILEYFLHVHETRTLNIQDRTKNKPKPKEDEYLASKTG